MMNCRVNDKTCEKAGYIERRDETKLLTRLGENLLQQDVFSQ